ncbi:MAG: immunoglobulin domain-containing protein, partial [Chryseobacterium sp.]|nr:immunoglobulin domain-containing protein [Chryseobacterium sp.]
MKKFYTLVLFVISLNFFAQKKNNNYSFYENKGQILNQNGNANPDVKYLLNSPGLNVQIKANGFSYDVYENEKKESKKPKSKNDLEPSKKANHGNTLVNYKYHRVDIDFVDSKSNPEIVVEDRSDDYENYYNLPDKKEGVSFVHRYKKVIYKNLYNNIDLVFFKPKDSTKPVEYNFLVHPGGKISDIKMRFAGAKTKLKDGKLSMNLRFGEMQENIPNSWIENDNKQNIAVNYKDLGNQTFGFESSIDSSDKTIVIDPTPTRIWGSYFGGSGEEYGEIKPDKNNNIYLFGYTQSPNNIATTGSYQNNFAGGADAFITKISKDGQRFWGTYYGRPYFDTTGSVDIDDNFNVYAAILSSKPNPRYPGNYYYYHQKIAMLKLDPNGNLVFNKEIGSETGNPVFSGYFDEINIFDFKFLNDKLYVIGDTRLGGFGTPGTFQENISGGHCGFLSKFDAINGDLDYFTYVGGNGATTLYKIFDTDSTGIEIMGWTRATNFPMVNAFQSTNNQDNSIGGNNGLYLQFSPSGNLIKSSYIGDKESYTFTGTKRFGDEIMFAAKMNYKNKICYFLVNTSLNIIIDYKEVDVFNKDGDVYVDSQKNIFTTGRASPNDPWVNQVTTPNSYLPTIGSYISIFLTKYDINLQKIWSTFYQGNGATQLGMMIKDYDDYLYLWGMSSRNTTGIATPGTFQQTTDTTSNDMFIAKFKDCSSFAQLTSNSPVCEGKQIELGANGGASYDWTGPNGFISTIQNPKIPNASLADAGTYTCVVSGTGGCDTTASITIIVGDTIKPIPDIQILPKITGDCKTIITTIPTAKDNCKGT